MLQGRKTVRDRKILEVHVDKGMTDGQKIVFSGEGDQEPELEPGDLVIVLDEKEHEVSISSSLPFFPSSFSFFFSSFSFFSMFLCERQKLQNALCHGTYIFLLLYQHSFSFGVMSSISSLQTFKRSGHDLIIRMNIELVEALCGFQKVIRTLDDRDIVITVLPGEVTKHGDVKCVMNEGVYNGHHSSL